MSELNFEFSSKEAYIITVEIVRWIRHLYNVFYFLYLEKMSIHPSSLFPFGIR